MSWQYDCCKFTFEFPVSLFHVLLIKCPAAANCVSVSMLTKHHHQHVCTVILWLASWHYLLAALWLQPHTDTLPFGRSFLSHNYDFQDQLLGLHSASTSHWTCHGWNTENRRLKGTNTLWKHHRGVAYKSEFSLVYFVCLDVPFHISRDLCQRSISQQLLPELLYINLFKFELVGKENQTNNKNWSYFLIILHVITYWMKTGGENCLKLEHIKMLNSDGKTASIDYCSPEECETEVKPNILSLALFLNYGSGRQWVYLLDR